jgi:hypothetical protein
MYASDADKSLSARDRSTLPAGESQIREGRSLEKEDGLVDGLEVPEYYVELIRGQNRFRLARGPAQRRVEVLRRR